MNIGKTNTNASEFLIEIRNGWQVNLWNLTHVLAGAVRVEKNLCRGPPHRWELLSLSPSLNVIQVSICVPH